MPHRKKVSAEAKSKQQSGQPTFTHVEEEFSEDGSVYIDSGEEEIWWDEDESDRETQTAAWNLLHHCKGFMLCYFHHI